MSLPIKIKRKGLDNVLLKRQSKVVDRWVKAKGKGTLVAPTGCGKTFIGMVAIERCFNSGLNHGETRSFLVVVPTIVIRDQWLEIISNNKLDDYVDVAVANTASKNYNQLKYSCIILDEVHRFASPKFKKCLQIDHDFRLGLTASLERSDERHKIVEAKMPVMDEITVNEALENGWISDFTIYNYGIDLYQDDQEYHSEIHKKFKYYFSTFDWDFDLAMRCTNINEARKLAYKINKPGWTAERIQIHAVQFSNNMRKRKEVLYNTHSKLDTAIEVLESEKFKEKKVITFSQAISMADDVTNNINYLFDKEIAVSYHSNLESKDISVRKTKSYKTKPNKVWYEKKKFGSKKLRDHYLSKFNDGRTNIRIINTAKALDEGFDVGDLDRAIILSGTSEPRQFTQRLGRILRKKPNKHAIIVCVYIKGTQDSKWLRKAQDHIRPDKIIEIDSPDQIDKKIQRISIAK